jgi:hypothetical protein
MPILEKISKRLRGVKPCRHLYLEKFIRGGGDGSIESGSIALEKPSPSLEEWSYLSVGDM